MNRVVPLRRNLLAVMGACAAPEPGPGEYYDTPRQKDAAALSGGAGYHGSVLRQAPAADPLASTGAKPARAEAGKLPLPVGYPLLPGDDGLGLPVVTSGPGGTLCGQVLMSECVGQRLTAASV